MCGIAKLTSSSIDGWDWGCNLRYIRDVTFPLKQRVMTTVWLQPRVDLSLPVESEISHGPAVHGVSW